MDFLTHVFFFLLLSAVIVAMGAFYSEPTDSRAFQSMPLRYAKFVAACGAVALVMLVLQFLFASVS